MKTLIAILLVLSLNSFGQAVQLINIDPSLSLTNPINVGDSSYIGLNYVMYTADSFLVYLIKNGLPDNAYDTCHNRIPLHTYRLNQVDLLPEYYTPVNNCQAYKMGFKIPNVSSFGYGIYKLWLHPYGNCSWDGVNACNGMPNGADPFLISSPAGIPIYNEPKELLSTAYYNLLGQPVKEPDGITVRIRNYNTGTVVDKIIQQ